MDVVKRFVVVSPATTTEPASPGRPFQICMSRKMKGEVVGVAPVWYAKVAMLSIVHVVPAGTVKLSASLNRVVVVMPPENPAFVFDCVVSFKGFWSSLHVDPAGAATPLFVRAPVESGPLS
jgi:hypothetical protein